jgi:hypothetical protein
MFIISTRGCIANQDYCQDPVSQDNSVTLITMRGKVCGRRRQRYHVGSRDPVCQADQQINTISYVYTVMTRSMVTEVFSDLRCQLST